jgi:hypothetical protein
MFQCGRRRVGRRCQDHEPVVIDAIAIQFFQQAFPNRPGTAPEVGRVVGDKRDGFVARTQNFLYRLPDERISVASAVVSEW